MQSRAFRLSAFVTASMAIAAIGTAADTFIPARGKVSIAKASPINTYALVPAIDRTFRPQPTRPENPLTFLWKAAEPRNPLRAGGMLTKPRAHAPETLFPGIDATGWVPPDPDLGVGPNQVVAVVNSSIAFFDKANGRMTFQRTFGDFFAGTGATSFIFDPKAFYDPLSRRFFVIACELESGTSTSKMLLAVSDDSDPNGSWFRYRVDSKLTVGDTSYWLDYPGFGTSRDLVGFCGNMFGFTSGWAGNMYVLLPKAPLLTGAAVTGTIVHDPGSASVKIATVSDTPNLFGLSVEASDRLRIQSVTNAGIQQTNVRVPAMRPPQTDVTGPNSLILDALDGRLFNAHWRAGTLVTTHGVSPLTETRTVSRWYDIRLNGWPAAGTTPTLTQSGQVSGPAGEFSHMPAIAKNRRNELALVFSRTNSATPADLMITGRKASDALGTMGAPVRVAASPSGFARPSQNRWGDYFGLAVDPIDDTTFWGIGMTGRSDGNWTTTIFNFKVSNYADFITPVPVSTISTLPSQGILGTEPKANLDRADNQVVTVQSQLVRGLGQVASLRADYTTSLTPSTAGALRLNFTNNAPNGASSFLYLWNYTRNTWEQIPVNAGSTFVERIENAASAYVSTTGRVSALLRVVQPLQRPGTYTLRQDRLGLEVAPRQ
ncbi:MAG: hypothetical protein SFX74_10480 [Fimbriimonadaceae bacterium]|nr:hypothetical protein [Fimbriimonadaceae bacterium]